MNVLKWDGEKFMLQSFIILKLKNKSHFEKFILVKHGFKKFLINNFFIRKQKLRFIQIQAIIKNISNGRI